MERNLKLTIEYDGGGYHGWQIQPNGATIQDEIEKVLARLAGERPKVIGSGRTDAGVHAQAQVAHVKIQSAMDCGALQRGLNALLPDDIVIHGLEEVAPDFHARYSARGKLYRYVILNRSYGSAFERGRCWQLAYALDLAAMNRAGRSLTGRHDFSSFQASDCCARHPNREVRKLELSRQGDWITIQVEADAFLKHMVRNIVGTLVEVGRGKLSPEDMPRILGCRDRNQAGPTAPAQGLFLVSAYYD